MQSLEGSTILITGASSGLGRATARSLAAEGARLVLWGRDRERLEATRDGLPDRDHIIRVAEISDADGIADSLKTQSGEIGELHGIFHAAGTELVRPARLTKDAQIAELFGPAVHGALGIARAAASKGVVRDGGSVVFMSSVAAQRGTAGMTAYSAGKAAVDGMVRSLACELAVRRIRVNSIAAGAVVTEMHERLTGTMSEDAIADYERRHPLGFGRPEDVAYAALFLFSDMSRWITGTSLVVDGGYLAQ
jgi:NAD(P)-dependent dehydrogenase (short-subunit alcohol dehydrogenase family)